MTKFEITREFKHADDLHPVPVPVGEYEIAGKTEAAAGTLSKRCAEVAEANGWGHPLVASPVGNDGSDNGGEKQPSSPPPAPASAKKTSRSRTRKARGSSS